jgi:hypothetical protein
MRKTLVSAIVSVAAVLGTGVAAATVITPGTWTVSPGGTIAGSGTATLAGPSFTITCSISVSGTAVGTATGSPATLASVPTNGIRFTNCTSSFTITQVGTWVLRGVSYDDVAGVTTGIISGINLRLSEPACTATIPGSVGFTYTNSTKQLRTTSSNLTVTAVSGCFGLLQVNQHPTFSVVLTFPGLVITASGA